MRSLTLTTAILVATLASNSALAQAGPVDNYSVELNKTEVVRLPQPAGSIIIGNPDIADVSVHALDTIFVVGRGYGQTNLIILDQNGNTMLEADLNVVNTLPKHGVRLFNAKERETYSCIPYCQASPVLGDTPSFITRNTNTQAPLNSISAFSSANTGAGNSNNANGGNTPTALAGANNADVNDDDFTPNTNIDN